MKPTPYTIIYRQGTPQRFRWKRTLLCNADMESLAQERDSIKRMGYHCLITKAVISHDGAPYPQHGLPDTFAPGESVQSVLDAGNGWSRMEQTL